MKRIVGAVIVICLLITGANLLYAKRMRSVATNENKVVATNENKVDSMMRYSSYPHYTLENLVNGAEIIVKGTVVSVSSPRWNNTDNHKPETITGSDTIYKDTIFRVDKVYKGAAPKEGTVAVRSFGGETEDYAIIDDAELKLSEGAEAIVFLAPDDYIYNKEKAQDHYVLTGALQSVYEISGDEVSNVHERMKLINFEQKVKYYLSNPRPVEGLSNKP
ncbi:MAG: hypothetical protein QME41_09060 [Actinomycetota bacterium]|nr:hypothetical protein [Actinomycetota bacterium]